MHKATAPHRNRVPFLVLIPVVLLLLVGLDRWLSVTEPVPASVLIVESWFCNRSSFHEAAKEISKEAYNTVLVVGGVRSQGEESPYYPDLAVEKLTHFGVEPGRLTVLYDPAVRRHRTYTSAVTARDWLTVNQPELSAVNVFSIGVHARKSRVLFRKAFGENVEVGIIASTETAYPAPWWFVSMTGVRLVSRNVFGLLYEWVWTPTP